MSVPTIPVNPQPHLLCRIRPRPAAIHFRPWSAPIDEHLTVLDWCLRRLHAAFSDHLPVLVVDEVDADRLEGRDVTPFRVVVSPHWSDIDAWLGAAAQLQAGTVTAVHLEAGLCPGDCGRLLTAAFSAERPGLAYFVSLPTLVGPERVNVRAAMALRAVAANDNFGTTFADLFVLAELASVQTIAGVPCTRIRVGHQVSLPREPVAFESQADIDTLRAAAAGPGEPLDQWARHELDWSQGQRAAATAAILRQSTAPSSAERILFVSNPSALSGAESSTLALVRALQRDNVETSAVVAYEGDFTAGLRAAGCTVYCENREFAANTIGSWNLVARALADFNADIMHYCGRSGLLPLQVAAGMGKPVLYHGHVPLTDLYRGAAGWADRYVAVSQSVAEAMIAAALDPSLVIVVPSGIDPGYYAGVLAARDSARESLHLTPDAFVLVTLSRFSAEKRLHDIVDAVAIARRTGASVELLMAGEGHSAESTRMNVMRQIEDSGLSGAVRLLGHVTDVRPLLSAADAVVICSDYEGLPMVALEAMASGIPIIATPAGGLAHLVGEAGASGACGLRISAGRPEDLAAAIELLRTRPDVWRALSRQGTITAAGEYSISHAAGRMRDIYHELRARPAQ